MSILNGYGTLQEFVNRYIPDATLTAAQNASIERIIQAVSRLIDLETHRQFWATASQARVFTSPKYTDMCWIDDAVTVTGVALDLDQDGVYEQALVLGTDYVLKPDNAAARGLPYVQIQMLHGSAYSMTHQDSGVQVTGTWGYSVTAPDPIQEACYIQSYRQYLRNATPFGIAGSGEMGVMTAITKLDPDVARLIAPYIDFGGRE